MTTESHLSHPVTPRRTYLIGRARPNAIVGRNRETGEIALIIGGAFLGMMCGLLVPFLALRIVLLMGFWKGRQTGLVLLASASASLVVHTLVPGAWYIAAGALAGLAAALMPDRRAEVGA